MRSNVLKPAIAAVVLSAATYTSDANELVVSAAASLGNAFRELAADYTAKHPDNTIHLNFAGSGALLQQIDHGAPVDVFATADQQTMDMAAQQGLLQADSRHDFARNTLVLIVPANNSAAPAQLADLRNAAIQRIAIAHPENVPAGRYSKQWLQTAGLWNQLQDKLIYAQHVRQALDYVARGEVDAGLVYGSDAASVANKVAVALTAPPAIDIRYPIAVIAASDNSELATDFIDYVLSADGVAVLEKHGFNSL